MDGTAANLSLLTAGTRVCGTHVGPMSAARRVPLQPLDEGRRGAELPAQPYEQRLERQRRAEVELLERPPRLPHDLARALGAREPLRRPVLGEHREPVGVDDGTLRA